MIINLINGLFFMFKNCYTIYIEESVIIVKKELNNENYYPKHAFGYNNSLDDDNTSKQLVVIKRKKRRIKIIWVIVILLVFIAILLYSLFKILNWNMDNKKTSDITNKIDEITTVEEVEDTSETELVNEEKDKNNPYWYYITFPLIDVNINELKGQNSDTVGWINVNNTNINYPFVQTGDNDFYLTHSFDKSYNDAGWIFLDYRNNSNFEDRNNIIYGHSRLDKTMFGSLSKVLNSSWYNNKDNHVIRISLDSVNTLWQIFSVYKIKTETYYITTNFNSDSDYLEFLNTIKDRSLYDFNANLNKDDKILTLSTCYSDTERTVVHARLIKKNSK